MRLTDFAKLSIKLMQKRPMRSLGSREVKNPPLMPLIVTELDGSRWVALENYLKIARVEL